MTLRFIDLFGGIGGFRLGIQQSTLDAECVGYYDQDKFAVKSYNAIFNERHEATDVTALNPDELPEHNLICAGFPCQSFSIAGRREGFEDTRGTLFFEICRIAEAKKPAYLLLENVRGLHSHNGGETFRIILESLGDLGYDVEWQVFNSRYHSVPQNRERVFIVGHLRREPGQQVFPIYGTAEENPEQDAGTERGGTAVTNDGRWLDGYTGTIRSGGNSAMDDSDASFILDASFQGSIREYREYSPSLTSHETGGWDDALVINHQERPETRPSVSEEEQSGGSGLLYNSAYSYAPSQSPHFILQQPHGHNDGGLHNVCPTLTSEGSFKENNFIGSGWRTALLHSRGFEVKSEAVSHAVKGGGGGSSKNFATDGCRIRKLTPRECWRLQGFPDWAFGAAEEENSDTQLYKQAGNAVTVNVVKDIADELAKVVQDE